MAEGGQWQRPFKGSFSKASGDADELVSEASGDADELVEEASGDADELVKEVSGDADELVKEVSGDADELVKEVSGDADELAEEASGGVDELVSKASGDADESFCAPCKRVGDWKAVDGYCQVCYEYMCRICLAVHRKQKLSLAHAILDKEQMPSGRGSADNYDLCVDVCQTHHPEIIRFHCKDHDESGCSDCMTLKHMACMKDRLQDISRGFQNSKEFEDIDEQLQQLLKELEQVEDNLQNNLKSLDLTYNRILSKIATIRRQINASLDQIENKIKDEAAKMKKQDETELNTLQTEHKSMQSEIEDMLKTLHATNANVNTLFITSKQAEQRLVAMQTEINSMKQSQQQHQYEFHISSAIENIISAKTPLGKISRQFTQKYRDIAKKQDHGTQRTSPIDITATYNRSIKVTTKKDKKTCYILDCTIISTHKMVVIDIDNKNVKLIDLSNDTVISSYSPPSTPYRVTALTTSMIAVTLRHECKLQVLNVTPTITLQREINIGKDCYGLAYKDGKFALGYRNPDRVEILDVHGKLLHTIQPKLGKANILREFDYIAFGHVNDTVIVSENETYKVSAITFGGQILYTYTHDTLKDSSGIVITADGVLFVCNWRTGSIHAVSPDFKTSKVIIDHDNHVMDPQSITYSESNHTLYISNLRLGGKDPNNHIQVYDLKVPV